jgi:predicted ABC-type ATPase
LYWFIVVKTGLGFVVTLETSVQFTPTEAARAAGAHKLIDVGEIRADLLAESSRIIKSALDSSSAQVKPRLVHLCGIPGAGKTTYAGRWMQENPDFALVQFDSIMEALHGYRSDVTTIGLVAAFANWELPARIIGYHLLHALIEASRNVLFDHSAAAPTHVPLLEKVKASGYLVEMHHLQCVPSEALMRIKEREAVDKRHTPPALVHERLQLLKDLVPRYEGIVDRFISV